MFSIMKINVVLFLGCFVLLCVLENAKMGEAHLAKVRSSIGSVDGKNGDSGDVENGESGSGSGDDSGGLLGNILSMLLCIVLYHCEISPSSWK